LHLHHCLHLGAVLCKGKKSDLLSDKKTTDAFHFPLLERYPDGSGVQGPHSRVQTSHKASSSTVYVRGLRSILADEEVHMAFLPAHWRSAINHAAPSPHTPLSPFQRWNSTPFTFQAPSSIWIFVCSQSGDQCFFFQVQLVANVATQLKVNLA